MMKLNLGCGGDRKEGYVNIDIRESVEPDVVLDLEKESLPYGDNSVDEVIAYDFLEHISFRRVNFVLKEIHRVLKPNGILELRCPDIFRILYHIQREGCGWEKASFWFCGAQDYPENLHKSVFWKESLKRTLEGMGFEVIKEGFNNTNFLLTLRKK